MNNRPLAIVWLAATLLPLPYMFYFMWYVSSASSSAEDFDFIFRLHTIVIIYMWALIASYIVYLFKSKAVPSDKKALWAVVLFMGNMLAMPFFWYFYVWQKLTREPGNS